jgi:hypothetical protein
MNYAGFFSRFFALLMVGVFTGTLFSSSVYLSVQGTSARP